VAVSGKYTVDGIEMPSVTTVIGMITDKGALVQWAANCAIDFIEQNLWDVKPTGIGGVLQAARYAHKNKSKEAAGIGSQVHDMIEAKIKGKPFDRPDTLEAANAYEAFLKWEKENIAFWIETEQPIHDEDYWFAGTLDALAELKTGEIACIDFKTSKGHYDGFGMQLAAYGFARPKLKGTHKIVSRFGEYLIDYKPIKTIQKYICLRIDKLTGQPDPKDYTKNIVREYHRFLAGLEYWYLSANRRLKNNPRAAKLKEMYK
jgi:hypothetical protein